MPLPKEEVYGYLESIDGERIELDRSDYDDLRSRLRVIAGGSGRDPWLTTGQAAEELGVSRRTLTRMLDRGEIRYERYGTGHRRLRMSDVLRYKTAEEARRKNAYEELNELYFDRGMDDLDDIEAYLAQFE